MDEKSAQQKAFEEWENIIEQNFLRGMLDSASEGIVSTHEVFDKFSSWLLVGTGATAALIIVNIDKIIPYVTKLGLRWGMIFLTISALAGFIAKVFEINASVAQIAGERTKVLMMQKAVEYQESLKKFDELAEGIDYQRGAGADLESFAKEFTKLFPFKMLRNKVRRLTNEQSKEFKPGNYRAVHAVVYQSLAVGMQALMYLVFLVTVACSINFVS